MKYLDINSYPNLLDHLNLSSKDVTIQVEGYSLSFPQVRNEKVEWGIAFPMFLTPFYKYVYLNNKVLTQSQFYEYYLTENKTFFDANKFDVEILEGLKARIYRTYPSLVRDLHFSLFVNEKIEEAQIVYNRRLDVEEGIDLLIKLKDILYAINLFTDTARAHIGREKKVSRHTPFDNVQYVELPVKFNGSFKCGNFFLYGEAELNQIKKIIYQL
jgi:hypothetical protein